MVTVCTEIREKCQECVEETRNYKKKSSKSKNIVTIITNSFDELNSKLKIYLKRNSLN